MTSRLPALALGALLCYLCSGPMPVSAGPVPVLPEIDGNLDDLLSFAEAVEDDGWGCGLVFTDPSGDATRVGTVTPCTLPGSGDGFANGFDLETGVVVYYDGSFYLGLRTTGAIGDADGDGNCTTSCSESDIPEAPGIGPDDVYRFELDPDCGSAFDPELVIQVSGDSERPGELIVTTAGFTARSIQAVHVCDGGRDLEIRLFDVRLDTGMPVEPLYTARILVDSSADGLEEDVSDRLTCSTPRLEVTAETYFEAESVCPGDTVTVSVSVMNWSWVTTERVSVIDDLPPGWTYVPGSAIRIGEPEVRGEKLRFPDFPLWPVEGLWFRFRAVAGEDCQGVQANLVTVDGALVSPCVLRGETHFGPLTARASVPCLNPTVDLEVGEIASCLGVPAEVAVTATNTSPWEESISLVCSVGNEVVARADWPKVAPGETVEERVTVLCSDSSEATLICRTESSPVHLPRCSRTTSATGSLSCTEPSVLLKKSAEVLDADGDDDDDGDTWSTEFNDGDDEDDDGESDDGGGADDDDGGRDDEYDDEDDNDEDDESDDDDDGSTAMSFEITLHIENTGPIALDPVLVTDHLSKGLELEAGSVSGCGVSLFETTAGSEGLDLVWEPFSLESGASCEITYRVRCADEDGENRKDVATVEAWCAGALDADPETPPVTDADAAPVRCGRMGPWGLQDHVNLGSFPNPCVGEAATVYYQLTSEFDTAPVVLEVYDVAGRCVRRLVEDTPGQGLHAVRWDLRSDQGQRVPSGVYFYRMRTQGVDQTQRMLVLRR